MAIRSLTPFIGEVVFVQGTFEGSNVHMKAHITNRERFNYYTTFTGLTVKGIKRQILLGHANVRYAKEILGKHPITGDEMSFWATVRADDEKHIYLTNPYHVEFVRDE